MSSEVTKLTKENLDGLLLELAKTYKKLTHGHAHAEFIFVGGASILVNYSFRESTMDIDAVILADSAIKEAANQVADHNNLPRDWLNADFRKTSSFSEKLRGVSKHYKTYANVVEFRTITDEYLIAMKLTSGRKYKNDQSDILGILCEKEKYGAPLTMDDINRAVVELYGSWEAISEASCSFIQNAFADGDFKKLYEETRDNEIENQKLLNSFAEKYPNTIRRSNINDILASLQEKKV